MVIVERVNSELNTETMLGKDDLHERSELEEKAVYTTRNKLSYIYKVIKSSYKIFSSSIWGTAW